MPAKKYKFDFYKCETISSSPTVPTKSTADILSSISQALQGNNAVVRALAGREYELRQLVETSYGFKGIVGKHRSNDLPTAAIVGGPEREIVLGVNENLLEKAYFAFFADFQILIIQRNAFCISSENFGKYLSEQSYVTTLNPIIAPADLEWLLNNRVQVRTAQMRIARPTNPDLFQEAEHDFNNAIIATLKGSSAAVINLSLRGNARSDLRDDRYLSSAFKAGLVEMQSKFDVRKCEILLENEDTRVAHPIDLVADRLVFEKTILVPNRNPPAADMWQALEEARLAMQDDLVAYFGNLEGPRLS